ncbi:MAG TPA: hypothetical protein PKX92_12585 [Edaphocola sp.]|nr:hypothetical protein [Edaphocola sp.]
MPHSHIKTEELTQNKTLKVIAKIISIICHPVFMPVVMSYVLYKLNSSSFSNITPSKMNEWLGIIGLNTIFFPLVTVFLLRKLNFIESIELKNSKDRIIPLIATMIFYFWAYTVFKNIKAPTLPPLILQIFLLGNFYGIIALFMVNIFKKVSMHAAAAGGMIGIFIVVMIMSQINLFITLIVSLLIAGLIGTSRLILRAHTQGEIGLGYFLGIAAQLVAFFYMTKIAMIFN